MYISGTPVGDLAAFGVYIFLGSTLILGRRGESGHQRRRTSSHHGRRARSNENGERFWPHQADLCFWLPQAYYGLSRHRVNGCSGRWQGDNVKELVERCELQFLYYTIDSTDFGHAKRIMILFENLKLFHNNIKFVESISPFVNYEYFQNLTNYKSNEATFDILVKDFRRWRTDEVMDYINPICENLGTPPVHTYRDLFNRNDVDILLREFMGKEFESLGKNISNKPRQFLIEMEEYPRGAFSSDFKITSDADKDFVRYFWPDFDATSKCFDSIQKYRQISERKSNEILYRAAIYKKIVRSYGPKSVYRFGPFLPEFDNDIKIKFLLLCQNEMISKEFQNSVYFDMLDPFT